MLTKYLETYLVKFVMGLCAPFILLALIAVSDLVLKGKMISIAFIVSAAVAIMFPILWCMVYRTPDRNLGNMHGIFLFMMIIALNPSIQANNATDVLTFRYIIPIASMCIGLMIFILGAIRIVTNEKPIGYSYILSIMITLCITLGSGAVYAVMLTYLNRL